MCEIVPGGILARPALHRPQHTRNVRGGEGARTGNVSLARTPRNSSHGVDRLIAEIHDGVLLYPTPLWLLKRRVEYLCGALHSRSVKEQAYVGGLCWAIQIHIITLDMYDLADAKYNCIVF